MFVEDSDAIGSLVRSRRINFGVKLVDSLELAVIARSSVMRYRSGHSIEELKQRLAIDYLVEGSVRQAGGRVRITAQLVNVHDQTQLWARTYERDWVKRKKH